MQNLAYRIGALTNIPKQEIRLEHEIIPWNALQKTFVRFALVNDIDGTHLFPGSHHPILQEPV